jgi:Ni,Fe-hydrogenase maturation factor
MARHQECLNLENHLNNNPLSPSMTTILCFGNEFIKEDSLAKELADEIKLTNINFIKCNSFNEIIECKDKNLFILDVVEDITEVIQIKDINQLKENKLFSLHDFDLGFFLKLMKSLGEIKNISIIGIPQKGNKEVIKKEVIKILK